MKRIVLAIALLLSLPTGAVGLGSAVDTNKLSTTAVTLLRPVPTRRVTWCIVEGGAAAQTVIFRGVGGTPEYARLDVAAGANTATKLSQNVNTNGLEVVTVAPAGDVSVICTVKVVP